MPNTGNTNTSVETTRAEKLWGNKFIMIRMSLIAARSIQASFIGKTQNINIKNLFSR